MQVDKLEKIKELPIFFIIGSPRSGTTLLRTFFDAHPNIQIPLEMPFLIYYYNKYKNTKSWDKETIDIFINELFTNIKYDFWSLKIWKVEKEDLRNEFYKLPLNSSYADFAKVLYLNFKSIFPKETIKLVGDKNPVYSYYLEQIQNIFPKAKFIHIVRDFRDHILSLEKVSFGSKLTPLSAMRWKLCQKKIERQKKRFPENYYSVKYEDLVNNPQTELEKMCAFLNINFKNEMLYSDEQIEKFKNTYQIDGMGKYHSGMLKQVNTSKVEVWKKDMAESEIEIADLVAGKYAERYGYERKYKKPNPFLNFYLFPIYAHLFLQWFIGIFVKMLPNNTKNKIVFKNSIFEKWYEKIYLKIRDLDNQKFVKKV